MGTAAVIITDATRAKVRGWVEKAPAGTHVTFKGPRRSLPQNDKMWAMLTDISGQLTWHGMKYSPEDWKDYAMHALKSARWMPSEDGGLVPIGMRTSELAKDDMSDLLALLDAFGTRHSVVFTREAA